MKRLLALAAVFIPLYLFAQGFGSFSHDQPYFAKDATSASPPDYLTGIALHWVASDLDTNTPISIWTDRIQGNNLVQTNASLQPTNLAGYGVRFNAVSNHRFNVTNFLASYTNGVFVMLCNLDTADGNDRAIFGSAANITGGLKQNTLNNLVLADSNTATATITKFGIGVMRDVVLSAIQGSSFLTTFTNGIESQTNITPLKDIAFGYMGRRNNFNPLNGYITEFRYYTNPATVSAIQTLHTYLTNTYGFSP